MAAKRIVKEFKALSDMPEWCLVTQTLDTGDLFTVKVVMMGPLDSPFQGGAFNVCFRFPPDYPFRPPDVTLETPVYHPNVGANGKTFWDAAVDDGWSPATQMSHILLQLQCNMKEPDLNCPISLDVAHVYASDRARYEATAAEWTARYALPLRLAMDIRTKL